MHCLQLTHSMYQILNPRVFYYKILFFSPATCSINHIATTMSLVVSSRFEIFRPGSREVRVDCSLVSIFRIHSKVNFVIYAMRLSLQMHTLHARRNSQAPSLPTEKN
jgi:hypothetical protein